MRFVGMKDENVAVFEIEVPVKDVDLKIDLGLPKMGNRIAAFDARSRSNGIVSDQEWDVLELAGANVTFFENRRHPLSDADAALTLETLEASCQSFHTRLEFLAAAKALQRANLNKADKQRYENALVKFIDFLASIRENNDD